MLDSTRAGARFYAATDESGAALLMSIIGFLELVLRTACRHGMLQWILGLSQSRERTVRSLFAVAHILSR
jgi:hypothetical protein